jgi:hypothetical protein
MTKTYQSLLVAFKGVLITNLLHLSWCSESSATAFPSGTEPRTLLRTLRDLMFDRAPFAQVHLFVAGRPNSYKRLNWNETSLSEAVHMDENRLSVEVLVT